MLYIDVQEFCFVKTDPNMRTLSFYEEILRDVRNIQTFSITVDTSHVVLT